MSDEPKVQVSKIRVFTPEYTRIWPINLVIGFNPQDQKIHLVAKPSDFVMSLGMVAYAQGKLYEEMFGEKAPSNIITGAFGGLQIPKI